MQNDERFDYFNSSDWQRMNMVIDEGGKRYHQMLDALKVGDLIKELNKAMDSTNSASLNSDGMGYLDQNDVDVLMGNINKIRDERAKAKEKQDAKKDSSEPQPLNPGGE